MSPKLVQKMNHKYRGRLLIMLNSNDTHMMNGFLTVRYLEELVGPALRRKRKELGLPFEAKAGLIADAFTGNETAEYAAMRKRWAANLNVVFVDGIPGGWSKNGQPCDRLHALFRALTDVYEATCKNT